MRARGPGRDRAFAVALLAVALGWLVHSLVDWDWDIPARHAGGADRPGRAVRPPARRGGRPSPARPPAARAAARGRDGGGVRDRRARRAAGAVASTSPTTPWRAPAGGTAADLREAQETAALAKRLNPFAVEPLFAQAAIAERGNQLGAAAGLLVEAVERQPSNPTAWTRLARFQLAVGDSRGALRSIVTAASLDRLDRTAAELASKALYDHNRSASATGTPLPERLGPAPAPASPPRPRRHRRPGRRRRGPRPAGTHPRPAGAHARAGSGAGASARAALAPAVRGRGRAVPAGGLAALRLARV